MPVQLTWLLDQDNLALRLVCGSADGIEVEWAHAIELQDPSPWLAGGELRRSPPGSGCHARTPSRRHTWNGCGRWASPPWPSASGCASPPSPPECASGVRSSTSPCWRCRCPPPSSRCRSGSPNASPTTSSRRSSVRSPSSRRSPAGHCARARRGWWPSWRVSSAGAVRAARRARSAVSVSARAHPLARGLATSWETGRQRPVLRDAAAGDRRRHRRPARPHGPQRPPRLARGGGRRAAPRQPADGAPRRGGGDPPSSTGPASSTRHASRSARRCSASCWTTLRRTDGSCVTCGTSGSGCGRRSGSWWCRPGGRPR